MAVRNVVGLGADRVAEGWVLCCSLQQEPKNSSILTHDILGKIFMLKRRINRA